MAVMKGSKMQLKRRRLAALICTVFLVQSLAFGKTKSPAKNSTDWSREVVNSTIKRFPTAESLKGWGYAKSLYLYGQYLVYLRTKDPRYLDHIQAWIDLHIDEKGTINRPITALDYMLPGNLCLILYKEKKLEKYKLCADSIRKTFDTYPRTKDGGFWHANIPSRQWQLWADGVFMGMPFLARYGKMFGDSKYTDDEVTKQMLVYYNHLYNPEVGLLHHAYDESGAQAWADKTTHRSAFFWCRAIGWYAMTLIELLDVIPKNHPNRAKLISIVNQLAVSFERYQDPKTGLWWQIVDKGGVEGNWLETSSSSMYSYMMWMGVKRGYLPKKFRDVALKGYRGVMTKLSIGEDGMTNLIDICEGTNVSDLAYYFARKRNANDFHGIGAFLIMNEQLGNAQIGLKAVPVSWTSE
jgi:unsaturated rhamnogalacturonyl hydrolase